ARSAQARRFIEPWIGRPILARRFIEYGAVATAVEAARQLHDRYGITSSLFYLGEYVDDPTVAEETVRATCEAGAPRAAADPDAPVSFAPRAVGSLTSEALCRINAVRIGEIVTAASKGQTRLMLDMEDLGVLDATLSLFQQITAAGVPAGVTLQAR